MAIHSQLTRWIADNASDLDLHVDLLHWPSEWMPGFAAIAASIRVQSSVYDGCAVDRSEDAALIKAVVESIERYVKHTHNLPNTSGLAGHITSEQAQENGLCELIERDAFFCHYISGTPD